MNCELLDTDMTEILHNNPVDVVYTAFSQAFFRTTIRLFQRDTDMKSIVLPDADARELAIRHFFNRALREVREGAR
jgi:type I restriction enzyme R subunit